MSIVVEGGVSRRVRVDRVDNGRALLLEVGDRVLDVLHPGVPLLGEKLRILSVDVKLRETGIIDKVCLAIDYDEDRIVVFASLHQRDQQ